MGIYAFKLPDIGEGVVEGEVVEWMVSVGDTVKEDDPILSVMTDKATVEIPSPTDGVVKSLVGEPGTILAVGQVCIEFETDGEGTPVEEAPEPVEEVVEEAPEPEPEPVEEEATPEPTPAPAPTPVVVAAPGARPLASPAVRQRARESGSICPQSLVADLLVELLMETLSHGRPQAVQSQLQGLLELHRLELLKFLLSGCEERFQRV